MKMFFKIIGYIFMAIYFLIAISVSILVLNENEYGITVFGNKYLVTINMDNENDNYHNGDLVIVESKKINDFQTGDEIFLYNSSIKNIVDIHINIVKEVSLDTDPKFITVNENTNYYRTDSILGKSIKRISTLGGIINFLKDRIIFLVLLIVPSVILLIFEIYMLINKAKNIKMEGEVEEE